MQLHRFSIDHEVWSKVQANPVFCKNKWFLMLDSSCCRYIFLKVYEMTKFMLIVLPIHYHCGYALCQFILVIGAGFKPMSSSIRDRVPVTHNYFTFKKPNNLLGLFADLTFWRAWDQNFVVTHIQLIIADCTDIILHSASGLLQKPVTSDPPQAGIERSPEIVKLTGYKGMHFWRRQEGLPELMGSCCFWAEC